jgi:hypothetical protein
MLVEFRRRLSERGSLKKENGFVIALVVNEPKIGSSLQPSGTGTTNAASPSERHRNRLSNDGG